MILLGAALAFLFANFHWRLMDGYRALGLLDDENAYAVRRVLLGVVGVLGLGVLVPQTMRRPSKLAWVDRASAVEYTASVFAPSTRAVRMTLTAIFPRSAIRILRRGGAGRRAY